MQWILRETWIHFYCLHTHSESQLTGRFTRLSFKCKVVNTQTQLIADSHCRYMRGRENWIKKSRSEMTSNVPTIFVHIRCLCMCRWHKCLNIHWHSIQTQSDRLFRNGRWSGYLLSDKYWADLLRNMNYYLRMGDIMSLCFWRNQVKICMWCNPFDDLWGDLSTFIPMLRKDVEIQKNGENRQKMPGDELMKCDWRLAHVNYSLWYGIWVFHTWFGPHHGCQPNGPSIIILCINNLSI